MRARTWHRIDFRVADKGQAHTRRALLGCLAIVALAASAPLANATEGVNGLTAEPVAAVNAVGFAVSQAGLVSGLEFGLISAAAAPERFAEAADGSDLLIAPLGISSLDKTRRTDGVFLGTQGSSSTEGEIAGALALPEAPSAIVQDRPADAAMPPARATHGPMVPRLTKYVPSGMSAPPMTQREKFYMGLRDLYSPLDLLAVLASSGYEQVLNSQPNYGTDRGAFGQRVGAAVIREATQGFFTDSVFSPLLRQDLRYYIEGSNYSVGHRVLYAATRPLIGRTDSGRSTINSALLLGYAASAALTYAYYPQINRNAHDTAATFGGSIGGAALGFGVSEFSDQLLQAIHMKKKP